MPTGRGYVPSMSNEPQGPQTPVHDDQPNEEFGPTETIGEGGYPEEGPAETKREAEPHEGRSEQPQRDEG